MTYNERVQAIAEEMAKERYPKPYGELKDSNQPAWAGMYVSTFLDQARIAVKHMAEAVQESWCNGEPLSAGDYEEFKKYAINKGLIPDNSQNNDPSGPYAMGPGH